MICNQYKGFCLCSYKSLYGTLMIFGLMTDKVLKFFSYSNNFSSNFYCWETCSIPYRGNNVQKRVSLPSVQKKKLATHQNFSYWI